MTLSDPNIDFKITIYLSTSNNSKTVQDTDTELFTIED